MLHFELKPGSVKFIDRLVTRQRDRARSAALREADASRDAGRFERAAEQYGDVVRTWGAEFGVLVQLGNMLKDSGALDEAEAAYEQALLLNPFDADCHLQFGHLMKVAGRLDRAKEYYLEARRLEPGESHGEAELKEIAAKQSGGRAAEADLVAGPPVWEKGARLLIMRSRVVDTLPWRRN